MAEVRHGYLTTAEGIHIPYQWEFASASERESASGLTSHDEGKLARQMDDDSIWMLIDASGVLWKYVGGNAGSLAGRTIDSSEPSDHDVLMWNASASEWQPSGSVLLLDQASPQTIENGIPLLPQSAGSFSASDQIVNKAYVDSVSSNGGGGGSYPLADHIVASEGGTASTISDALAAASTGESIFIAAGKYEENITVSSPLKIFGIGWSACIYGASSAATVTITGASVLIEGLQVENEGACPLLDLQGAEPIVRDMRLVGGKYGIYINGATKAVIERNFIQGQSDNGIWGNNGSGSARISFNVIRDTSGHGIAGDATEFSDSIFKENRIEHTNSGIRLWGGGRVIIEGNSINHPGEYGIYGYQTGSMIVANNQVFDSTNRGISLDNCGESRVAQNSVRRGNSDGIYVRGSHTQIHGNEVRSCNGDGIELYGILAQSGFQITGNFIADNGGYGIELGNTSTCNVLVHGNVLKGNSSGSINHDTGTENVIISDNLVY